MDTFQSEIMTSEMTVEGVFGVKWTFNNIKIYDFNINDQLTPTCPTQQTELPKTAELW